MTGALWFLAGAIVGATLGVLVAALCFAVAERDT